MNRVLIIGGGFGGIRAALALEKQHLSDLHITLVSDRPHFEYHATLYRVVTGRSPLEACIPLSSIFSGKKVDVVRDRIRSVDPAAQIAHGASGSHYAYDFIVLALGSETSYPDIPGLRELSFGFKSVNEALRLKNHIRDMFASCRLADKTSTDQKSCAVHFVVVGGGLSGVELAGELALYAKTLATEYDVDQSLVAIDLVEAMKRILPSMPETVAQKAERRLRALGITIHTDRAIIAERPDEVVLNDMRLKTKTVIWTAGTRPHRLYSSIPGLSFGRNRKVIVDETLRATGQERIFVIGDAAETPYSGMAQTAIQDALSVARSIPKLIRNELPDTSATRRPAYIIPVGSGWAIAVFGRFVISGRAGWWLRRLTDFVIFLIHLPIRKSIATWHDSLELPR